MAWIEKKLHPEIEIVKKAPKATLDKRGGLYFSGKFQMLK
jgi:hypothetical protein